MKPKIAIVGSGRVAEVLTKQFCDRFTAENISIIARNDQKRQLFVEKYEVHSYSFEEAITEHFDFIIIAVKDEVITTVSEKVATFSDDAIVCHTSGCVSIDALSDKITNKGVFYPLQSITGAENIDFSKVPIFIEAKNDKNQEKLCTLAKLISENITYASSKTREKLHLCAVFANNFTNHIFTLVNNIIQSEGVSSEALKPIIETTFERILCSNPKHIQTGPARRADIKTINRHLELINDENTKDVYKTMTNSILNLYKNEL